MVYGKTGGQVLFKSGYWKGGEASKALLLSIFSQELPQKRKILKVQAVFCKMIDVIETKVCFLAV